jgi:hypothetical protein
MVLGVTYPYAAEVRLAGYLKSWISMSDTMVASRKLSSFATYGEPVHLGIVRN